MSVNVVVHDTRLEGRTPISTASALSFDVDDSTHIEDFFDRVVRIADEHSGIGVLYLMCHGVTVLLYISSSSAYVTEENFLPHCLLTSSKTS